jgi:hypothetical protein
MGDITAAQVVAPEVILTVLLLTALVLREAFGPVDIVRWVLAGSLPYLALPHIAAAELAIAQTAFPLQLLQPQGISKSKHVVVQLYHCRQSVSKSVVLRHHESGVHLLKVCQMLTGLRWLRRPQLRSCSSGCRLSMCRHTCSVLLIYWTSLRYPVQ